MNDILVIILMLVLSAFFSGMEIAFISANRLRIELDKKQGHFASSFISVFENNQGKYLSTMLVGNNVALVVYSLVMARILEPGIERFFQSQGMIIIVQTVISTLLILVAAEFLPKLVFRSEPNIALNIFALPVMFIYVLFFPLTSFINWISEGIIRSFHREENTKTEVKRVFNKIDLVHLIDQAKEEEPQETAQENDLKLFQNALDFSSVKVRDCMVPRTEIVAIEIDNSVDELHKKIIESDFSKILVYKDNIDNIVGYITSKSLLKNMNSIREKVIDLDFVPEAMQANRLLEKFIQDKKSMAVVVDEFGGVSGMLTIEDIIEEIFGEIEDEHDTPALVEKQVSENEYILSGRLEIDYLNDKYNLKLPESEDYGTLAGFIFHHYENIPKLNERIRVDPFEIKILKVSKTKIDLVHLKSPHS